MSKIQKIIFILIYTLFVTAAGFAETYTWVGIVSDNWGDYNNWKEGDSPASGYPSFSSDEAIIPSGTLNKPKINKGSASVNHIDIKNLKIEEGAELIIQCRSTDVTLTCNAGIVCNGKITIELQKDQERKVIISNTQFTGSSRIFIDGPSSLFNSAYHTILEASGNINFKYGSVITADDYANDDRLIINSPTVAIAGSFTVDSKLEIKNTHSPTGVNINISGSLTAKKDFTVPNNANTNITSSGTVNLAQSFIFSSIKWIASNGTITAKGNFRVPNFEQNSGSLNLEGGSSQSLNIKQAYNLEIESLSTTSLTENIKISNSLTNTGKFKAGNKTVTLNPPANGTVTITGTGNAGNTEFHKLTLTNAGGKTLTIKNKITVVSDLDISGSAENNLLKIEGPGEITLVNNQTAAPSSPPQKGYYLAVSTDIPIATGKTYTTKNSKPYGPSTDLAAGKPYNWVFSSPAALTWTGKNSNDWNTPGNWVPSTSPSSTTNVIIPRDCYNIPELDSEPPSSIYRAKHVTVESDAILYLKKNIITDKSLDNYGTVYMEGSDIQKSWLALTARPMFVHKDGSKIVYQAVSSSDGKICAGPYQNLIFESGVPNIVKADSLTVKGQLTVNRSITIDTGAGNQTYNGAISAANHEITLKGSTIDTKGDISANKIEVTGDWKSNSGNITAGTNIKAAKWNSEQGTITAGTDITVTGNWYSERSSIKGRNITSSGSKWTSWGGIEASGNIDIVNELAFTGGHIKVGGNLTAKKLNTSSDSGNGGLILFSGSGTRKLSGKDGNNIIDGKIQNLRINLGTTLQLESDITITVGLNNQGVFDAITNSKKVTLEHKINEIKIEGNITDNNTKFHELICSGAGGKKLTIDDNITVANLSLLGTSDTNRLEISTTTGTEDNPIKISLGSSHNTPDSSRKFLKINTLGLKIITTPPYVVDESVDYNDIPQSANGWVFVKPSLTIENSFAKPGDNHIYLLFNVNAEYLSLEEFKALGGGWLKITKGSSPLYTSTTADAEISGGTWKIQLDNPVSADHILDPSCKVTLTYFNDPPTDKPYISDIGIDMVKPLKAFNSIVLYDFGAESDDPSLVTLDVTIPSVIAGSDDVKLYFISKDGTGSFWYPNTITPPPQATVYANSQMNTHEYSPLPDGGANQIKFIIPSTDSYLVKDKVGQFMFVYKGWLPCARLKDPNNILSFDVWNFKIVGVQKQKGGVSVFNNVINPNKNQEATIGAHLKKSGMLTIQIMTLDGNVVRTLERSHKDAGDHFVNWDGRNNGGNPVASGMYFVRIAGPEIDEVRKILVVK